MTIPITVNIPEELYQRAKRFAHLANRDLESVITDTLLSALPPMGAHIDELQPIETLSNEEVLALARSQMEPEQDAQMSELLAKQRENELTELETIALATLMQAYQEGWIRKTTALAEAVKRGLVEPLDS
ncbi:MAG: hypothetical protein MUF49_24210 [Oculatellaceae cyanobacterium Prado106]|jgi:hypothetical protein|nr:hypothetical protein [Oculatellaceae cyanobacterium Prado106]